MSPLPTPINIGNVAGSAVGAVNTGVGVVTSVAPEATKVAGEAAPIVADVAQNAGKIDLEKVNHNLQNPLESKAEPSGRFDPLVAYYRWPWTWQS